MIRLLLISLLLPLAAQAQSHADFRRALIKHEGYSLTSYVCQGRTHIGIGHLLPRHSKKTHWTPAQVEAVFQVDLSRAYHAALTEVSSYPDHPPGVRIVLVELAFQCGQTGLRGFRRFIRAINQYDYPTAAQELRRSKLARQTPGRVNDYIQTLTRAVK